MHTVEQLHQGLTISLAKALYLDESEIKINKTFVDLGLDSIVGVEWIKAVNKEFGLNISATGVYDYPTIEALAAFIHQELADLEAVTTKDFQAEKSSEPVEIKKQVKRSSIKQTAAFPELKRKLRTENIIKEPHVNSDEKIAIVGMSGRYPGASNLQQYWENLSRAKNSITEILPSRWSLEEYYDPDPSKVGKMYCKWMGMLDDADCFDPLFFQIPPSEAEFMDPQHRIFLEQAYKAFEHAGYSSSQLTDTKCGVFMGIMSNDYNYHLSKAKSTSINITGNSFAIGAARIAYFLNLKGPAIPIDTACSSSLVAIHLACRGLLNREMDMALAGGVSLYLNPDSYIGMCQAGMLSAQGQCKTFDNSADGFVPGEGAGALVLKRLEDAERDNDFIYGVILGSGINQDGRTNGITAPSVNSQILLERDLYNRYKINPESISYIEAHGTGTKLGDPIELEALSSVFRQYTSRKNFCALGSVKSNIGHTSGAAGVASVQKVLLSLKHKTIVPTLNVNKENTVFDFQNSPFYISKEKQAWNPGEGNSLRRAAISSFGFSGTNAHLVIQEYRQSVKKQAPISVNTKHPAYVIVLSARTKIQLDQKLSDLSDFINDNGEQIDMSAVAYTLQTGRDEMRERLGFIVSSARELQQKLRSYMDGNRDIEAFRQASNHSMDTDAELTQKIDRYIKENAGLELLELWVRGIAIDWNQLYKDFKPQRIGLPTYPFAKERYWVEMIEESSSLTVNNNIPQTVTNAEEAVGKMAYRPLWKASELMSHTGKEEKNVSIGSILIFDTNQTLLQSLKKRADESSSANTYILVKPGEGYQQTAESSYTINPTSRQDYDRLVESLRAKDQLPNLILHQGTVNNDPIQDQVVDQHLNASFYTFFYLSKALIKAKVKRPVRMLSFFSDQENAALFNQPLTSFFKTLRLENPNFKGSVLRIKHNKAASIDSTIELADIAYNEFWDKQAMDAEICYNIQNHGQCNRQIRVLSPIELKADKLQIKQGGVYIISGGLGGLGLVFSEYLVKNFDCKLILFGRSELKPDQEHKLQQLKSYQSQVLYMQADVSKLEDMKAIVKMAKDRFSQINGVIHSAGVNRDSFILKKSKEQAQEVLEPKIYGAINLDLATKNEALDAFILFSSIAGVFGNVGQCDYAYANGFLDSFSALREEMVSNKERSGVSLSINWPYWEEGGMDLGSQDIQWSKEQTGLYPLPITAGTQYLEEFLELGIPQAVVLYGLPSKLASFVENQSIGNPEKISSDLNSGEQEQLEEKTINYLKNLVGSEIKLDPTRIDSHDQLDSFGIDSIIINRMNTVLEKDLGTLSKTLFYEYSTLEELAAYLIGEEKTRLIDFFGLKIHSKTAEISSEEEIRPPVQEKRNQAQIDAIDTFEPMAIIGVHGYYPESKDLNKYWENLRRGRNMTGLVPEDRWDYKAYYHSDPNKAVEGKIYCKWGGFVDEVDQFDPHFFNISPEEARSMDPQERLFLESVWATIEDAGYTRESLKKQYPKAKSADVGVFVGATTNTYNLLGSASWSSGNAAPGAHPWSIANRVSYFFDFQGPSMPVDTACSSSSVAIHLACESLKKRECQVAIAGGVNLYLHPSKYHSFCKRRMVSLSGKCHSYGAGDDGFVPGEGVGSLMIKPLKKAIEDRDHIYGVIKGSAYDHSGRSNGYATPNPNAQADLIWRTMEKSGVTPRSIGYVEGHGTGTQLGDSLEIVALTNAFRKQTTDKQFCAVGSVKANIGHGESAAGIAGVAKVLMQFKHRQLAPSINSDQVNPNIAFEESPFYLQHKATAWNSDSHPRRALINSFGAGGVNACLLLEEYENTVVNKDSAKEPYIFVLSATNKQNLIQYTNKLLAYLGKEKQLNLQAMAYTLQLGREALSERLAIVTRDRTELLEQLKKWKQSELSDGVFQGRVEVGKRKGRDKSQGSAEIRKAFTLSYLKGLAEDWVSGIPINWELLYPEAKPWRIPLPTATFSRQRYWFTDAVVQPQIEIEHVKSTVLHPLVSYNSSTLRGISFSSLLSDQEFYARDHQVNKEKIFPGAGFLEIAATVGHIAGEQKVRKVKDVVWINPLSFSTGSRMVQTYLTPKAQGTAYQITSFDDEYGKIIHCEGKLEFTAENTKIDLGEEKIAIKALMENCPEAHQGDYFYGLFERAGFHYGPGFRSVQEFYTNGTYAISKLQLADQLKGDFDQYIIHPSLLDGAMQTVASLITTANSQAAYLPFAIDEIEIIRPLSQECFAYVQYGDAEAKDRGEIARFNIDILNQNGVVLMRLKNFYARAYEPAKQLVSIND